jgi:hypothetical protein
LRRIPACICTVRIGDSRSRPSVKRNSEQDAIKDNAGGATAHIIAIAMM